MRGVRLTLLLYLYREYVYRENICLHTELYSQVSPNLPTFTYRLNNLVPNLCANHALTS